MTVRCAHCGEELLGAVNRCWKCGKQFAAQPTVDGLPPVRVEAPATAGVYAASSGAEPLEARVLDDAEPGLAETTVLERPISVAASESPHDAPPPSIFPLPPNP